MRILMMTNTFAPHVGGVARSVQSFADAYRRRGHEVLVVAPEFEGLDEAEPGVARVPAIQNFNGSDFSVSFTMPRSVAGRIRDFSPEIVHSHHPFLIGASAVRTAEELRLPLVFTHHTRYEEYTHYVPGDSPAMKRFVIRLSVNYAQLCDLVFAPSGSIAELLRERGVTVPIEVVPTGVDPALLNAGSGPGLRACLGIPEQAVVVGHVGRLAPEKNLGVLALALARVMQARPEVHALVVGDGPSLRRVRRQLAQHGVADRVHMPGVMQGLLLASAYRAMDVFAFASTSETQGMVLTEAMAAGVPVVALDAPGVRDVVQDGENGVLVHASGDGALASALLALLGTAAAQRRRLAEGALATARALTVDRCAARTLTCYAGLVGREPPSRALASQHWRGTLGRVRAEWAILRGVADAAGAALRPEHAQNTAPE